MWWLGRRWICSRGESGVAVVETCFILVTSRISKASIVKSSRITFSTRIRAFSSLHGTLASSAAISRLSAWISSEGEGGWVGIRGVVVAAAVARLDGRWCGGGGGVSGTGACEGGGGGGGCLGGATLIRLVFLFLTIANRCP